MLLRDCLESRMRCQPAYSSSEAISKNAQLNGRRHASHDFLRKTAVEECTRQALFRLHYYDSRFESEK